MTDRYRVSVERVEQDADGDDVYRTVAEFMAPRGALAAFVPNIVAGILGSGPTHPQDAAEADTYPQSAEASSAQQAQDAADEAAGKPKRTRRTKAQIAADNAAQALGFRDAAHQAEVAGGAPTVLPAPALAIVPPPAAEQQPAAPAPSAAAAPAAPYNPFG
jgi:hypothetical protein